MSISVKVVKLPGRVSEYVLDDGATVEQALDLAKITLATNSEIKVNGDIANKSRTLANGDNVLVSEKIKGN